MPGAGHGETSESAKCAITIYTTTTWGLCWDLLRPVARLLPFLAPAILRIAPVYVAVNRTPDMSAPEDQNPTWYRLKDYRQARDHGALA